MSRGGSLGASKEDIALVKGVLVTAMCRWEGYSLKFPSDACIEVYTYIRNIKPKKTKKKQTHP